MNHMQQSAPPRAHLGWIDIAKGLTIVLVVILYANEWVDNDANAHIWLQHVVDWATPIRMPAFFLISGLLLSASIQRDWRTFLDGKVVHFAYFYLLWLTILICFQAPWTAAREGWFEVAEDYFSSLVRPYSMLWFIYLLPIFFVVTKLLRSAPAAVVWTAAAVLQILDVETGVKVLDKFMPYYVFFYSGYVLAPTVFALARSASANRAVAVTALAGWAVLNTAALDAGLAQAPGVALLLGLLGGCALITACALLEKTPVQLPLAYCGRDSLIIYLGFYIPLVIVGKLALSSLGGPSTAAILAVLGGVCAPLALHRLIRGTRFAFLFERPSWFSLKTRSRRQQEIGSAA